MLLLFFSAFIGLYFSKTVLSISPYVLIIVGLTQKNPIKKIKAFFSNPAILSLFLVFILYLLSGINSQNHETWISRLNTNLIFMAIPFGIFLSGPYKKRNISQIIAFFVIINFLISLVLLLNYMLHFSNVNSAYLRGQTIYTPVIHVRYSYFVALTTIFSFYLYISKFFFKYKFERKIYCFIAVFSFIFLHILAVRTGIFALYTTIVLYGGYYSLKYKKIKWLIGGIIFLVLSISLSLVLFPSFKNKIKYMVWDIKSTIENKAQYHTSDRIRIYSIANGIKIFKEHPLFGTGIGDLENEMKLKYKENYPELPEDMQFEPINQFVYILSGMGIIGFILYFGLLILPIFIIKNKHKLLVPFYILTFATFIGETTIEFMIGKTTFLILASLFICYNNNEE